MPEPEREPVPAPIPMDPLGPPPADHARSSFFFRTTGAFDHTPRMQLAASIRIEAPGEPPLVAWLSHPCIAESMYRPADLIQLPVATFTAIAIADREVAFLRRTVEDGREARSSIALGTAMPTHSGIPALMRELRIRTVPPATARRLHDARAIRAAIADGTPIVGRTRFLEDGATIVLDYPVTTVNASNDDERWQVDAGPVLLPGRDPAGSPFAVDRLEPGYLVANEPGWAEIAGLGGTGSARPRRIVTETALFAIG